MSVDSSNPASQSSADVSRALVRTWKCVCSHEVQAREWTIVDCLHRADLVALLKTGSMLYPKCPKCGVPVDARMPLVLARVAKNLPLVVIHFRGQVNKFSSEDVVRLEGLYELLKNEYGLFPRLTVSDVILTQLFLRDIDLEITNPPSLPSDPANDAYLKFLEVINDSFKHEHRMHFLKKLAAVLSLEDAIALLKEAPELLEPESTIILEDLAKKDVPLADLYIAQKAFLTQASKNLELAYETYYEARNKFFENQLKEPVRQLREQIELLAAQGKWHEVVSLAERGLEFARPARNDYLIAEFSYNAASAICNSPAPTPQGKEEARRYLEEALDTEAGRRNAHVYLQLSTVYASRSSGDPFENIEKAIELAEDGISRLSVEVDAELWAMAQTNLSLLYSRRQGGVRLDNLKRAIFLCEEALKIRSPEIDADNWGFTMLALGVAKSELRKISNDASINPLENFQAVIAEETNITRRELVARAHYNFGCSELEEIKKSEGDNQARMQSAAEHLQLSLEGHKSDPILLAETHARFAELAHSRGDRIEEEKEVAAALSSVTPDYAPDKYEAIASSAAALAVAAGDWNKAAERYELALEAAKIRFEVRNQQERREETLRTASYLSRWAAAAFARCGDFSRAAEILEAGKAHTLGRRADQEEADVELLEDVSPQIAKSYKEASASVIQSRGRRTSSAAIANLNKVISEVRSIEGMADFLRRTTLTDLEQAVQIGWPVIYLNPSPHGLLVLIGERSAGSDRVTFTGDFLSITSERLIAELMVKSSTGTPYFFGAVAGHHDIAAIENGLLFVGEEVMRQVASLIENKYFAGLTVITSGSLSMLPVHVAQWQHNGIPICIGDRYSVRYAPSAHLAGVSYKKWEARRSHSRVFVAVANPNRNEQLPFAEAEVSEIATLFSDSRVRTKRQASVEFLENVASSATHLHLACHGMTEPFDYRNSSINLANGNITVEDLIRRGTIKASLSVASACQTAVLDQIIAEEGFSIGAALLAAGSAAAVATSWPVDDFPTALLMIRFYEILLGPGSLRPAEALREAQMWLRDLTQDNLQIFATAHPALARHSQTYAAAVPFASPYYWGAFVALGG